MLFYFAFLSYLYTFFTLLMKIRKGFVLGTITRYDMYVHRVPYPLRIPILSLYSYCLIFIPLHPIGSNRSTLETGYSDNFWGVTIMKQVKYTTQTSMRVQKILFIKRTY